MAFLCVQSDVCHLTVAIRDGYSRHCVQSDVCHLTVASRDGYSRHCVQS